MKNNEELKGLSGWLIWVGFGIVIAPIRLLLTKVPFFQSIFTDGTWEAFTTVGSEVYNPLWGSLLVCEIIYHLIMVIASIYLIYLFFSKHYRFPLFYILIVVASIIFIPLDAWIVSFVLPGEPMFDPKTTKEFIRLLIGGIIWVPYMLISKRVKATFVGKIPNKMLPTIESIG